MYQPGERWQYNAGSLVLGVLVARAVGAPLGDVMRSRLFEPLGMADTGFSTSPANLERLPSHYMTDFETGELTCRRRHRRATGLRRRSFPSGGGGLLSTADDFLTFARLLLDGGTTAVGGCCRASRSAR